MNFDPNELFYEMVRIYKDHYSPENKVVICNEGSSRSSKTWDTFHFIYLFCDHNRGKKNDIYILRDTLINCRDYTFKDFKKCMEIIGHNFNYVSEGQKPYLNLFGNNVYFRGLDDEKNQEGYPSDILFINEALEIDQKGKIAGLRMRCRKLMIMDWNPKFTVHWCFDQERNHNTFFTHSTYKNNKHLQKSVINEIESYEPWLPGSYKVIDRVVMYNGKEVDSKNQPPPHPYNITNNTADDWRWMVYGLGLRSAPEGLIFKYVNYIDEFPDMAYTYGLDFGFTADPSALVRHAEDKTDIYLELLMYQSTETPDEINDFMDAIGIEKYVPITADSADRYVSEKKGVVKMVQGLKDYGWSISKVRKTKNIMYWLASMKKKKINVVKNHLYYKFKKEFENYKLKEINGIKINQPIDGWDHGISSGRYSHMAHNDNANIQTDWE